MSAPSTPASSPRMRMSRSPAAQTPKRRDLAAMLAAVDQQFDEEEASCSPGKALKALREREAKKSQTSKAQTTERDDGSSNSEDDDIPVRKPVGRIAARMQAAKQSSSLTDSEEDQQPDNTRTKVRRIMSGKNTKKERQDRQSADEEVDATASASIGSSVSIARQSTSPAQQSRQSSPGLFVSSREGTPEASAEGSDSDIPINRSRLEELVAHKRAERKAREQKQRPDRVRKRQQKPARVQESEKNVGSAESDSDEGTAANQLTQQSRPARKASKKALEELSRETQRMDRNRQLAHQAKTKKKYSVKDLFAKFNYKPAGDDTASSAQSNSGFASSDVEAPTGNETPPTSPPVHDTEIKESSINDTAMYDAQDNKENEAVPVADAGLPPLSALLGKPATLDKGKGRAPEYQHLPPRNFPPVDAEATRARVFQTMLPPNTTTKPLEDDNSDDDLEIVHSRFPVFDRLPVKTASESEPLRRLKLLAQLKSPTRQRNKGAPSMNSGQLQNLLQRRALAQAQVERQEKISELKAKGIFIRTTEEREKDMLELENLLEKARQGAQALAKKEKTEGNEEDALLDDDSEDEEYIDQEEHKEHDVELSGSEDEANEEGSEEENGLIDDAADESDDAEVEDITEPLDEDVADSSADEEETAVARNPVITKRNRHVIDEEDDDEEPEKAQMVMETPTKSSNPLQNAFGIQAPGSQLGLTQMFAGTLANLESQSEEPRALDPEQDSLAFLREMPISTFPASGLPITNAGDEFIGDSQVPATQPLGDESSQVSLSVSQWPAGTQTISSFTQASDIPDPTQDVGIELSRSPIGLRTAPVSTIDTVLIGQDSPIAKKSRLRRRIEMAFSDVEDDEDVPAVGSGDEEFEISADAFTLMRKGGAKAQKAAQFDKSKSEAKAMFEEQAEESDDEYAGLGGASDDEDQAEFDEEIQKMMDESDIQVDERQMAAFFADKERAEDEKRIDKLYKDITNGGLRKRRGGDFDLSDSDDDMAARQRRKQRDLERNLMRKAILADENVERIASNPKKQAFFRALEDQGSDNEMDFLDEPNEEPASVPDSQTASENAGTTDSPPLKRKASTEDDISRPPPAQRRTAASDGPSRKPISLAEIRDSVSFLIDEPHLIPESQFLSDSEDEPDKEDDNSSFQADRRRREGPVHTSRQTIDRLSLSRDNSALESMSSEGNLAFHSAASSFTKPGSFRIPSLIRRASSRLSESQGSNGTWTTTSSGATAPSAGAENSFRRGGSKKSNIHYQAREAERMRVMQKVEKRRQAGVRKLVGDRARSSVLGTLNDGGFE